MLAACGNGHHPQALSLQASSNARNSACLSIQAKFLPESQWRRDAALHAERMRALLSPGFTGTRPALDPRHPIYNFLIEYYGVKGPKGVTRLMRWCPTPPLRCFPDQSRDEGTIQLNVSFPIENGQDSSMESISTCSTSASSMMASGVFLENASMQDIASGSLHLQGATFIQESLNHDKDSRSAASHEVTGILYCPKLYFGQKDVNLVLGTNINSSGNSALRMPHKAASAFIWYRTLLRNTLQSDPILYCHGETQRQSFLWSIRPFMMIGFDCWPFLQFQFIGNASTHVLLRTASSVETCPIFASILPQNVQECTNGPCFTTPTSLPLHHPAVNTNPTSLYEYPNKLSTNK